MKRSDQAGLNSIRIITILFIVFLVTAFVKADNKSWNEFEECIKQTLEDAYRQYHYWDRRSDRNIVGIKRESFMYDPFKNGVGFDTDSVKIIIVDTLKNPMPIFFDMFVPFVNLKGCRLEIGMLIYPYIYADGFIRCLNRRGKPEEIFRSIYIYDQAAHTWNLAERVVPLGNRYDPPLVPNSPFRYKLQAENQHTEPLWSAETYTDSIEVYEPDIFSPEQSISEIGFGCEEVSAANIITFDDEDPLTDDVANDLFRLDLKYTYDYDDDNGAFLNYAIANSLARTIGPLSKISKLYRLEPHWQVSKFKREQRYSPTIFYKSIPIYTNTFYYNGDILLDRRLNNTPHKSRLSKYIYSHGNMSYIHYKEDKNWKWTIDSISTLKEELKKFDVPIISDLPEYMITKDMVLFNGKEGRKGQKDYDRFLSSNKSIYTISTILQDNLLIIEIMLFTSDKDKTGEKYLSLKWDENSTGSRYVYRLKDCYWELESKTFQWNLQCSEKSRKEIERLEKRGLSQKSLIEKILNQEVSL